MWARCAICQQVYSQIASHTCPEKVEQEVGEKIDKEVQDEMDVFDYDYAKFLSESRTKFYEYLAKKGKI